jgi:3-oxoacyl-[acyl-carrier-protein] synthase II
VKRRVVVTGVGLISSVGTGTEENWSAIKSGKSGIGPITQFDTTGFAARIAGEVKNFDPLAYVDKKDVKKMGRFIQFGMAASEFAVKSANLKVPEDEAENFGVYIGSCSSAAQTASHRFSFPRAS